MSSLRKTINSLFDEADMQEIEDEFCSEDGGEIDVDEYIVDHMIIGRCTPTMEKRNSTNEHYWNQVSSRNFHLGPKQNSFKQALDKVHKVHSEKEFVLLSGDSEAGGGKSSLTRLETLGAVFDQLDRNGNSLLERDELEALFLEAAENISLRIDEDNIKQVIGAAIDVLMQDVHSEEAIASAEASMREASIRFGSDVMDQSLNKSGLASLDKHEAMNKQQFICMFQRYPDLLTVFASERRRLAVANQDKPSKAHELEAEENEQVWSTSWANHRVNLAWLAIYLAATGVAFATNAHTYAQKEAPMEVLGSCLVVARGSAQCLNLNCALILIVVARHLMTYLRATNARFYFPFDAAVDIHKLLGVAILFWTICHVSAHMCNYHRLAHCDEEDLAAIMGADKDTPTDPWGRWKEYLFKSRAGITGILMVLCMVVAYPLTLVRRKHFNAFWKSHHLLIVMLFIMCVHDSGKTVFWLAIPLLLYLFPRVLRETPTSQTRVLEAQVKPGGVLRLCVEKPPSWKGKLRAGQYGMLKVPAVSLVEWHPFTFTSSPSADPYLEFHIRNSGDFTHNLHTHVLSLDSSSVTDDNKQDKAKEMLDLSHRSHTQDLTDIDLSEFDAIIDVDDLIEARHSKSLESGLTVSESVEIEQSTSIDEMDDSVRDRKAKHFSARVPRDLMVHVDGPFGASSQGFSDFPILILVGAGIGVTPMISVLKELLQNPGKMERVYFYWTVRDRASFEWFSDLMNKVYEKDQQNILQVRHFLTSVKDDDRDIGAVLLNHARRSKFKADGFDLILGQQTRHQVDVGRPDWKEELRGIRAEARHLGHSECGIFLCGPDKMASTIKSISAECSSPKFRFCFHKETF